MLTARWSGGPIRSDSTRDLAPHELETPTDKMNPPELSPSAHDNTDKELVDHVEHLSMDEKAIAETYSGNGLLKSRFDELSLPRTLWVFRRSVLVVLAVYTGYMCEGFEVSVA